ncbi:MAG: substrate-binding domain-containing protein [Oscillospiraceae bacterium]|jgi:ABC-type phosphate transport system substrate-binding protein|nr:substrate-binding domain-containing protein [Oscillospiraceae bacterium]
MKRFISALISTALILLIFTSCSGSGNGSSSNASSVEPEQQIKLPANITQSQFKLDGSTACIPLAAALTEAVMGTPADKALESLEFTTTIDCLKSLAERKATLVLTYESEDLNNPPVEIEKYAISRDGLVFLTNISNNIKGITTEQARDIYAGKIKNWKEVGGEDKAIAAFQRQPESGSGVMLEKLVMKGTKLAEIPKGEIINEMGFLLQTLGNAEADLGSNAGALGYSVYYYVKNMYANENVRLLDIDGVAPSNATIASGEYPLTNEIYAVIRADEPQDSPIRQLVSWLQGAEGKSLIEKAGYVKLEK